MNINVSEIHSNIGLLSSSWLEFICPLSFFWISDGRTVILAKHSKLWSTLIEGLEAEWFRRYTKLLEPSQLNIKPTHTPPPPLCFYQIMTVKRSSCLKCSLILRSRYNYGWEIPTGLLLLLSLSVGATDTKGGKFSQVIRLPEAKKG